MNISVDDMFVMRDLNPLDPYRRGLGQAEALADEIEIDEVCGKIPKKVFLQRCDSWSCDRHARSV